MKNPSTPNTILDVVVLISPHRRWTDDSLAEYLFAAEQHVLTEFNTLNIRVIEAWSTIPLLPFALEAAKSHDPQRRATSYGSTLGNRFLRAQKINQSRSSISVSDKLHQVQLISDDIVSASHYMYDNNAIFRDGIDHPSRHAVDCLRKSRGRRKQTDDEWEQCREIAVQYMLHEYIYCALRQRAHVNGSSNVLLLYHGSCEWLNNLSTTIDENWGIPYGEVNINWFSLGRPTRGWQPTRGWLKVVAAAGLIYSLYLCLNMYSFINILYTNLLIPCNAPKFT